MDNSMIEWFTKAKEDKNPLLNAFWKLLETKYQGMSRIEIFNEYKGNNIPHPTSFDLNLNNYSKSGGNAEKFTQTCDGEAPELAYFLYRVYLTELTGKVNITEEILKAQNAIAGLPDLIGIRQLKDKLSEMLTFLESAKNEIGCLEIQEKKQTREIFISWTKFQNRFLNICSKELKEKNIPDFEFSWTGLIGVIQSIDQLCGDIENALQSRNTEDIGLSLYNSIELAMEFNRLHYKKMSELARPSLTRKETKEDKRKRRESLYNSLTGKPMERYRKIVKKENPNLRTGDKKFADKLCAMKQYFSELKNEVKRK